MDDKKQKKGDELEKIKKERDEYKDKYLRALADYQNFERRIREEKEDLIKSANTGLLLKLLPFLDNLDNAEVFVKDKGLQIAKDHFLKILMDMGLEEIAVIGREFDPHVAEAVDMIPGEKDNMVVEVLRKGFKFNGKVLRVAQVKVSKKLVQSAK